MFLPDESKKYSVYIFVIISGDFSGQSICFIFYCPLLKKNLLWFLFWQMRRLNDEFLAPIAWEGASWIVKNEFDNILRPFVGRVNGKSSVSCS